MVEKREGKLKPDRKLFFYSGHDVTLVNVMRAMNIIDQTSQKPDFGSALHFEMHHNDALAGDYEIKVR